jgi:outer membrane protein assembly factor BamA
MRKLLFACIVGGWAANAQGAINLDSLLDRIAQMNFYCLPTLAYQPETGYAYGAGGGYYFRFSDLRRISSITFNATYTQKHQFSVSLSPRFYLGPEKVWYVYSNINVQKYPDTFYGTGNAANKLLEPGVTYTSRSFSVNLQPQRFITKHVTIGGVVSLRNEKTVLTDSLQNIVRGIHVTGWQSYFMLGFGGLISYDSRNSLYYPTTGVFNKFSMVVYSHGWGSSYNMVQFNYDFRQYIPVWKNQVFAWQLYTDWRLGSAVPFQMMATVGGRDLMRGFSSDVYRDNIMAAVQGEYRFPVYRTWRGAVFCSAGDVFDSNMFTLNKLKVAYGAGVRFRITRANVNCRLDVTRNNYDGKIKYYFTAMEAF